MSKPMKRANGTGSVTKVSGNRRKPYQVMVTIDWTEEGKQKRKSLGYFKTLGKAIAALENFNENPYDISGGKATFSEVYEKWSEQHFTEISDSNINGIKAAYKRCEHLYNLGAIFVQGVIHFFVEIFSGMKQVKPVLCLTIVEFCRDSAKSKQASLCSRCSITSSASFNAILSLLRKSIRD